MTEPPKYGSTVYYGDQPRLVVHVEGTYVVTVPADCDIRGTHQGNLQNHDGEYQWHVVQDRHQHIVRCLDCVRDEENLHLPLMWRAGTCGECATSSVAKHLVEHPGHRCEVIPSSSDESKTRSKDTQRLLGGNRR